MTNRTPAHREADARYNAKRDKSRWERITILVTPDQGVTIDKLAGGKTRPAWVKRMIVEAMEAFQKQTTGE